MPISHFGQISILPHLFSENILPLYPYFKSDIHALRPHQGQIEVAFRFRSLLDSDHHPSEIAGE